MPDSITVAAFVVGLVLVIAAFIGKELKVAAVELPALSRAQRVILGALGVFLVVFGLTDGKFLAGAGNAPAIATPPNPTSPPAAAGTSAECFVDVPASDRILVPIQSGRRTDLALGSGQPRPATLVIEFSRDGGIIGGVEFSTDAAGSGFTILSVVDGACVPIETYENASRPGQPKGSPYNYDTLTYHFGDIVISMDVSYGEGDDRLHLRAQQTAP